MARDLLLLAVTRPDRLAASAWWWLVGKRLRARYRMQGALAALPFANARWMADAGRDDLREIAAARGRRAVAKFGIHLHIGRAVSTQTLRTLIKSIASQSHAAECVLVTTEGADFSAPGAADYPVHVLETAVSNQAAGLRVAMAAADLHGIDYLVSVTAETRLPRHALTAYAAHLLRQAEDQQTPVLLYGDEQDHNHKELWLKPEWDPRMLWSQDYVSAACAIAVAARSSFSAETETLYSAILHISKERANAKIAHVARVTAEVPTGHWCSAAEPRLAAVQANLPTGATAAPGPFATVKLQYPLPSPTPRISIVVATRDRVELLRPCVQGLLENTDYPDFEVIIVDNNSRDPETLRFMDEAERDLRVRVVRWPHPFNYSAINNFAARFATGEYLCLLNNDIEILEPEWLNAMVREAVQPGIGAVGVRLLYPDRSIQHAGVAIGIGNAAGHAHRGLADGEPGYFAQALIARGVSAVTAACLLIAKRDFDAVGGLDEGDLAVAYNDVDLCLKLRERGLVNVYTPAATLIHHESKSRGIDLAPEHLDRYMRELEVFKARWGTDEAIDPWHHRRLDRQNEVYR